MANKTAELSKTLNTFYAQPIARVSFELVITIVVVMFFALFAIRPTLLTMSDLIKEIDDKKTLDKALDQKIAALSTGQSEYLALEERLSLLDQALPTDPNVLEALSIIEKIASDRQVPITSVGVPELPDHLTKPITSEEESAVVPIERQNLIFKVTVASDYLTIQQLIKDFQSSRRLMVVDAIEYNVNEDQENVSLRATLTINMPYFGEPPSTGASPAPRRPATNGGA